MKQLSEILEGLLNNDISDIDASFVVDDFWRLSTNFGRGGSIRKDQTKLDEFKALLPAMAVWSADNAIKIDDRNAWGIAVGEESFFVLGDANVYEFKLENNQMKYACINANYFLGTATSKWNDVKRNFANHYEYHKCQIFWVDKKLVKLFRIK